MKRPIVIVLTLLLAASSVQASLVCPEGPPACDFDSIRSAINDGDAVIVVAPGTYTNVFKQLNFAGQTVRSLTGNPLDVVFDGQGGDGFTSEAVRMGSGAVLEGITVTNGRNGIRTSGADVVINNCIVRNNSQAGILIRDRSATIRDTHVHDNNSIGIWVTDGDAQLIDNLVENNASEGILVGSLLGFAEVSGSTVRGNSREGIRAVPRIVVVESEVSGNGLFGVRLERGGEIHDSTIIGNLDSGVLVGEAGPLVLVDGSVSGNTSPSRAGGVQCWFDTVHANASIIESDVVEGNSSPQINGCGTCTAQTTRSCDTGFEGVSGTQVCSDEAVWGQCVPDQPAAVREVIGKTCNDGVDNDQDGAFDQADADCQPLLPATVANAPHGGDDGDPVSTFTGELFESLPPDLHFGGPLPLFFARYYASGMTANGVTGRLGSNWRHNFEWSIIDGGSVVDLVDPRGRALRFDLVDDDWKLANGIDVPYQLVKTASDDFLLGDPRTGMVYTFSSGHLVRVENGSQVALSLSYAGIDLVGVDDGLGRALTFTYNTAGHLETVTDGTRTVSFGYTGDELTSVIDVRGKLVTYAYDPGGLLISWTLPRGNTPYTQTWDASARVVSQTDAEGNTHSFGYGPDGVTTVTDPQTQTMVHTHDLRGELRMVEDEAGVAFSLDYDVDHRRNGVQDRLGGTTAVSYHQQSGKVASITQADGTTTSFSYTQRQVRGITFWNVSRIDYPDGSSASFQWTNSGSLIKYTDRGGFEWRWQSNEHGMPLLTTNPKGGTITFAYHPDGTLASRTDPASNTTIYAYDALRRLQTITHPDSTTRTFTWDDADNPLTVTDERGNTTTLTWDDNGNLATITDALTNVTSFAYDDLDRLVAVTDPLGHTTSRTFDALGRVATITDRTGRTTAYGYDARSRLASITDPASQTWSFAFDDEAIPTAITDPLGHVTSFASDSLGRTTGATSPLGLTSGVVFDDMGRVTSVTNPAGETTGFTYDERGLVTLINEEGLTLGFDRDELGLVTTTTDGNGENWLRDRDDQGRLTSRTDPLARQETVTYDERNRPDLITFPNALGNLTFTYDAAGNPTQLAYSDATTLAYGHDALNRLTSATAVTLDYDAAGRLIECNGLTMTRDDAGRLATLTLAPGKDLVYAYDARGLLQSITDWTAAVTSFGYDAAGRLTSITRPNGVNTTHTWDDDDRLVGIAEGAISSITLTRDAASRTTRATRSVPLPADTSAAIPVAFSYDAASQISSAGYAYDALGRLTADPDRTYDWDLASRLESYTEGANTVTFAYDALGMRTARTEGGVTRSYIWNYTLGLPSVSVEKEGGADLRYYVHTPGGALLYSLEAANDARRDYHFDEMGNTLFLTDAAGAVVASYAYGPYGELLAETGAVENGFTWQGQWGVTREDSRELYQLRARWFSSSTRRFLSRDPVSPTKPREGSLYQYALSNPSSFFDPAGLKSRGMEDLTRGTGVLLTLMDQDSWWDWAYLGRSAPRLGSARPADGVLIPGDRRGVKIWLKNHPARTPIYDDIRKRQTQESKDAQPISESYGSATLSDFATALMDPEYIARIFVAEFRRAGYEIHSVPPPHRSSKATTPSPEGPYPEDLEGWGADTYWFEIGGSYFGVDPDGRLIGSPTDCSADSDRESIIKFLTPLVVHC